MTAKPFVIIASIAVTVAAGLVGFDRVKHWQRQAKTEAGRNAALAELYRFSGAAPGDAAKVSEWCRDTRLRLDGELKGNDLAKALTNNCSRLGFL